MNRQADKMNGFLTGLLVGGIIGSALAMLFTPITGRRLRKKISQKTDDIIEDVNSYIETGKEKAEEFIKEGKRKTESIINEAKKLVSS